MPSSKLFSTKVATRCRVFQRVSTGVGMGIPPSPSWSHEFLTIDPDLSSTSITGGGTATSITDAFPQSSVHFIVVGLHSRLLLSSQSSSVSQGSPDCPPPVVSPSPSPVDSAVLLLSVVAVVSPVESAVGL